MSKPYPDYTGEEEHEESGDDDIGALGSILSWDEDEEGNVINSTVGVLPDFVGYSIPQPPTLQQQSTETMNLPLPTQFTYGAPAPQPATLVQQQQQLLAVPQQQAAKPQAQPQHQQYGVPAPAASIQNPAAPQPDSKAPAAAVPAQAGATSVPAPVHQPLAAPSAFSIFPQQHITKPGPGITQVVVPTYVAQPGGIPAAAQQQAAAAAQYAAMASDPNSFLRQMQIAQLQQQFQAVQQQGGAVPAVQQLAFQPAVAVAPGPLTMQAPQPQAGLPAAAPDAASLKRPIVTTSQTMPPATLQRPMPEVSQLVSASDTDGEVTGTSAAMRKRGSSAASAAAAAAAKRELELETMNMTPAEKAKANRDRNREHARNTRLRKKAYLEKLKVTVDELCRERDTLVSERAGAANILVEMHNTRTEVLMSFFALRSSNEKRRDLWASILDESCFSCVMPVTPYRSFPASEVQVSKCQRTLMGIDGMMSDTSSLHVLLDSLVDRSKFPDAKILFRYTLVTEEAVVAGNQMMARWAMSTLNATQCGARMEVVKQGMLCCKFNSSHNIIGLELMFDVMALMLQLKQAAGSETFAVIPNTVQTCQRSFDKPMCMILADEPYTIVQVNKLWEEMTGYNAEDVVGKSSCRLLVGEKTAPHAIEAMMNEIRFKRPTTTMLLHYRKTGEQFKNYFLLYPLSTDSRITHYLALTTHLIMMSGTEEAQRSTPPAASQQPAAASTVAATPAAERIHAPVSFDHGSLTRSIYTMDAAPPPRTAVPFSFPGSEAVNNNKRPGELATVSGAEGEVAATADTNKRAKKPDENTQMTGVVVTESTTTDA